MADIKDYKGEFHDWYVKHDKAPPQVTPHGTEEDILKKLVPLKVKSWRMEGNRLIAETEVGPVSNLLPTDIMMTGIDKKGLPILEKIKQ